MKEPTRHTCDEDTDGSEYCAFDGEEWPCHTWRKWEGSKTARVRQLEASVAKMVQSHAELKTSIAALRITVREQGMLLRNGVLMALKDAEGVGDIQVSVHVEGIDATTLGGGRHRIDGLRHYNVKYTSRDGHEYEDGRRLT